MSNCKPPRSSFVGSGRRIEGGFLATHKQDFNAHVSGENFRHCATQVDMAPEINNFPGTTVQEVLENLYDYISNISGGLFVSIGNITDDGYASGDYNVGDDGIITLEQAFSAAFLDPQLQNGGVVVVKAGTYSLTGSVSVPPNITIWGEPGGVVINGLVNEEPMFIFNSINSTVSISEDNSVESIYSLQKSKLWNLTLIHDLQQIGGSSNISTPMISVQNGSEVVFERVTLLGNTRSIGNPLTPASSARAIETVGTSTNPTYVEIINSYIDGFSGAVKFSSINGAKDSLIIKDSKIRYLGTGNSKNAVETTLCNISIVGNTFIGEYDNVNFLSSSPIHLEADQVADDNVRCVISNNDGGLTSGTDIDFQKTFFDASNIDTASSSGILKGVLSLNNSWGAEYNSNSFYITVGDGSTSIGNITGRNALDIAFELSSSGGLNVPIIYVGQGIYEITNNKTNNNVSLIGLGSKSKPIIYLNFSNDNSSSNLFSNKYMKLSYEIKNIDFRKSSSSPTSEINTIDFDSIHENSEISSCQFTDVQVYFSGIGTTSVTNCDFIDSLDTVPYVSCFIIGTVNTRTLEGVCYIKNCNFKNCRYPFSAGQSISTSNKTHLMIENCTFDLGLGSGNTTPISQALPNLPFWSNFKQRYIWVDLNGNFSLKNCYFENVSVAAQQFEPVNQSLVNGGTHDVWIEIRANKTTIKDNTMLLPDQPVYGSNALVPSLLFAPKIDLNVEGNSIRGNLPIAIVGENLIIQGAGNASNESPSISISNNKITRWQRENPSVGQRVWDAMDCISIVLNEWTIIADESSFSPYPNAQISITNNNISNSNEFIDTNAQNAFTFGNNPNITNPISGDMFSSLVFIHADGWNINVSENLLDGWAPNRNWQVLSQPSYYSTLTVKNAPNIGVDSRYWSVSSTICNNKIIHSTAGSLIGNGQRCLGLYLRGVHSIVNNNFFTYYGSAASYEDGKIGWFEVDYNNNFPSYTNTIINNNIFHRNSSSPLPQNSGMYLNSVNDFAKGVISNNLITRERNVNGNFSGLKSEWGRIANIPIGWKVEFDEPGVNDTTNTTVSYYNFKGRG